jgi:cell division protein FtsX
VRDWTQQDWQENGLLITIIGMLIAVIGFACSVNFLWSPYGRYEPVYAWVFVIGGVVFLIGLTMIFKARM